MKKRKQQLLLIPTIIAIGFIPMIVHSHSYSTGLSMFDWFPEISEMQVDFFLYYKMVAIITIATIMCMILLYQSVTNNKYLKRNNMWYCMAGYIALVLLSVLFSKYPRYSLRGGYEVFESLWVVLGYVIISFYTYQFMKTEEDVKSVAKYSLVGISIITIIGLFQYFGFDLFRSTIGKMMITDPAKWSEIDNLGFSFPLKTSYTTLYNTNYLAFYFGLIIPIILVFLLFAKTLQKKLVYCLMAVICFITLIGSNSKSALLALVITFFLGCVILSRYLKKYFWVPTIACIAFSVIVIMYANRIGGFSNLYDAIFVGVNLSESEQAVTDIDTLDDRIVFKIKDEELHLTYDVLNDDQVIVEMKNASGVLLDYQLDESTFVLADPLYMNCSVTPVYLENMIAINVSIDGHDWLFSKQADGSYYYYNTAGKFVKIEDIEKSNIFSDSMLSGRGKIWNYILPCLKKCIFIGNGTNSFVLVYPQNDYVPEVYQGASTLIDVKAHCFYLQQFLENGLIALLLFLTFYIWYLLGSIKLYRKIELDSFISQMGLGIALGTFNYMIIAIANDSNVCTAPVFWALLGAGVAINEIITQDQQQHKIK